MNYAIGIDLGGTNIKGIAVTPAGKVLAEIAAPTGDDGTRDWAGNVRRVCIELRAEVETPPTWIGLSAPGLPARDQGSIASMPGRLRGIEGLKWGKFFKIAHPVPVLNDAQAALLGEMWQGAARRSRNVILLTLGTGVGGAAVVDGNLLRGHLGRAGHFGHTSLDPDGAPDITGTPGSLEDAIGGCTVTARSGGRFASTLALATAVTHGDKEAHTIWLVSVKALAAGVASLVNVLDPEVVVIGGGISRAGSTLFRPLRQYLNHFEWRPGGAKVRVVAAKLGDRAGAFGAAWNAMHFSAKASATKSK